MNTRPLSEAKDADLRLSPAALKRAAKRARELAKQTGTDLVFSHNGVLERLKPDGQFASGQIQELPAPYGKKP